MSVVSKGLEVPNPSRGLQVGCGPREGTDSKAILESLCGVLCATGVVLDADGLVLGHSPDPNAARR